MAKHPFWTISLYKVLLISIIIANFLETNQLRENFFVKMEWHTEATWYAPLLFLYVLLFCVWGVVYLVEVSFGLTMGAFTLRSRAGVARWLDIVILIVAVGVAYESWVIPSRMILVSEAERYAFQSDAVHLFSQFMIWIVTVAFAGALQSLSPWGEYRFDRTQVQTVPAAPSQQTPSSPDSSLTPASIVDDASNTPPPLTSEPLTPLVAPKATLVVPPLVEEPLPTDTPAEPEPFASIEGSSLHTAVSASARSGEIPSPDDDATVVSTDQGTETGDATQTDDVDEAPDGAEQNPPTAPTPPTKPTSQDDTGFVVV